MTLKKYISFGAVAMLAVAGLSSCDSKNDPAYIPAGSVSDAQRVFFAKNAYTQIVSADENSFDFFLYRPNLNVLDDNGNTTTEMPAQTVTISASCSESGVLGDLITVPTEVTFDAGSPNATIKVNFDPAKMTGNHYYPIVLTVDPAFANEYSITRTTLSVNKEEYTDWAPFIIGEETEVRNGEGSYTFTQYVSGTADPVRVLSRSVPTNPNDIQFQFQWLIDDDDPSLGWETFMTASTKDGGKVIEIAPQDSPWFASNYGEQVRYTDTYTYFGEDQYKGLSNFDPETGLFTLNIVYFISLGRFGNGDEFLQLRGYKDTNVYELTVQPQGQMEVGDKDYEMVSFSFTEAVSYVDYTVVEGELEEEEVNAVIEKMTDPEQTDYTISRLKESQNVALTFPSSGDYTVVAVGYNEAIDGTIEAKCSAYASFSFKTFNPYAGWSLVTDKALYMDYFISWLVDGQLPPDPLTVRVDKSDEYEGLYRITNPYADSEYVEMIQGFSKADFGSIEFALMKDGRVYFPKSGLGLVYGSDEFSIASYSYYLMAKDDDPMDPADIPDNYFGSFSEDNKTLTLAANTGSSQSFVYWQGAQGPGPCNIDFYLNLDGKQPAGMPAMKTGKIEKGLLQIMQANKMNMKASIFPAFYKAEQQGSASARLDRKAARSIKLR